MRFYVFCEIDFFEVKNREKKGQINLRKLYDEFLCYFKDLRFVGEIIFQNEVRENFNQILV